ncbi:stage V sporulation protein AC [Anaerotignum sp.]|uniref:stage V sporulation protein AC n=1 Tax=Anaerotignum sp. TaxID=2039241 RepID=UPI002A91C26F|nr:stage V sporulation protein AC [Anaerotignum sp.]MCI7656619.1 stage V sporulation protein AC [Clostridia bacterium]MDY5414642.1 stage V sporulation protein AC [Anaerotignum sp.]
MRTDEQAQKKYAAMVEKASPKSPMAKNCLMAFLSGGLICTFGQFLQNRYLALGIEYENALLLVSITLIFISAVLTAMGIYSKLGKYCGAGTEVPITGFANSVVSPAIEYRNAGLIMGMGAKMFVIAGPVIVYGTLTSVVVGICYYFLGR